MTVVLSWVLTLVSFSFANPYFTNLRDDQSLPEKCKEPSLSFFQLPSETFYVGRSGALSMGFTFEYPVSRSNATVLWHYFRDFVNGSDNSSLLKKINNDPELKRDFDIIMRNMVEQDFDFKSEGEVLEALAIELLYQEFPENMYYITGGVQYHESYSSKTIGELDIWVGRRDTCEAVAIGEVKLGTRKMLHKAHEQLQRFENFLIDHNASPFGGDYVPVVVIRN